VPHSFSGFADLVFALQLGWLKRTVGQCRQHDFTDDYLGAAPAAYIVALLRSTLIEALGEDFVRTARAKGLRESAVLFKHALRNSLVPVLTVMGPLTATLLTGSFVVEYVFAIPGMGRFFITAVTDRDYPLIMGVTLVYTALGRRQLLGRSLLSTSTPEYESTDHGGQ
jgi:oligopeptide transport system permease protein